jgi:hypothetical protein
MTGPGRLTDEKLVKLLLTEGDRLDRSVVDEIVRRGGLVGRLGPLVADPYNWNEPLPSWWAVVHAVYILGAVGTPDTVLPLLRSVRYAEACENDWVLEDAPAIFGRIGLPALAGLKALAVDRTTGWRARAAALEGLAAITLTCPDLSPDILSLLHRILGDVSEERALRQMAGHILLDLLPEIYRNDLVAFGKEERSLADRDRSYKPAFTDEDVLQEYGRGVQARERYLRDWLRFYLPEEAAARQKRWDQEQLDRSEDPEHLPSQELCPFSGGIRKKKCCLGKAGLA